MRYTTEQVFSLLDEVDRAAKHAVGPHPDLTISERLDLLNNVDKVKANRYDVLAQAYRELVQHTQERETDIKNVLYKLYNHGQQGCLDFVSIEDALKALTSLCDSPLIKSVWGM